VDISGEWYNELGSMMVLQARASVLTGKYHTAVGDADGIYELLGRISLPADENRTLGFVVTWQNDKRKTDSVTAWSGEVREISGTQSIITTWLLAVETTPADDWKSTLVGKDTFTRVPPSAEHVAQLRALRGPSHHLKA
jgi:Avidin family